MATTAPIRSLLATIAPIRSLHEPRGVVGTLKRLTYCDEGKQVLKRSRSFSYMTSEYQAICEEFMRGGSVPENGNSDDDRSDLCSRSDILPSRSTLRLLADEPRSPESLCTSPPSDYACSHDASFCSPDSSPRWQQRSPLTVSLSDESLCTSLPSDSACSHDASFCSPGSSPRWQQRSPLTVSLSDALSDLSSSMESDAAAAAIPTGMVSPQKTLQSVGGDACRMLERPSSQPMPFPPCVAFLPPLVMVPVHTVCQSFTAGFSSPATPAWSPIEAGGVAANLTASACPNDTLRSVPSDSKKRRRRRLSQSKQGHAGDSLEDGNTTAEGKVTTMVIRNLPPNVTQSCIIKKLNQTGFEGAYDFLYMPQCFKTNVSIGFCFVNFLNAEMAATLIGLWHQRRFFGMDPSQKALNIRAADVQGLQANLKRWATPRLRRIKNANLRPFVLDGKTKKFRSLTDEEFVSSDEHALK